MRALTLGTPRLRAGVQDRIGWITLNQPERRNAMSLDMWQALGDAARALGADPEVRVIVMHGEGARAFSAGADISEFERQRANARQKEAYGAVAAQAHGALQALDKPLIAMVQGSCIGGGLALALEADLRFASPESRFAIPAARLGLGYDYPGLARLARLVGPSTAKDLLFSARQLDAAEALRTGLVNAVLPADELQAHVMAYARRVADNAPLTVQAAKVALRVWEQQPPPDGAAEVAALVDRCFDSADYAEGRRAFLEKRAPVFKGR